MDKSFININTIIDESWEAYRRFQTVKNVIEKLHDECSDTYPMILFPSQLSQVLKDFFDDNQSMRISGIMELITIHGSNAEILKKEWDLYKQKPYKPHLFLPEKKKATKKAVDTYYPTETKDVYRPSGCFIAGLSVVVVFIVLSFFDGWMLWLLLTTVLPCFLYRDVL